MAGTCVALAQDNGTTDRALPAGILTMLTVASVGLMVVAARPASLADPVIDPYTSWRQDRNLALATSTVIGIGLALGVNEVIGATRGSATTDGPNWGTVPFIVIGFGLPFAYAGMAAISDHWRTSLLFLQLRLRGDFPLLGMRFIKDAYDHRIFRAEGASYQFRHSLLQDGLARDQEHTPSL
ncbi:hypothetical protein VR41_10725 [Streptomyces sp. NRRL B-1568]|nr:hypothetical protein VR41_10725 [Streptomyces sp. NRRL B-1568]